VGGTLWKVSPSRTPTALGGRDIMTVTRLAGILMTGLVMWAIIGLAIVGLISLV
jgi:hypothetical protein